MLTAPLKQGLVAALKADATVSGLVKANIFPVELPADVAPVNYPAITYRLARTDRIHRLEDGGSSMARAWMEIHCWAQTETQAQDVADAVRNLLDGIRPGTWTSTAGSVTVDAVTLQNSSDDFDEYPRVYFVTHEFEIFFHDA
jgi:hypothetical protein